MLLPTILLGIALLGLSPETASLELPDQRGGRDSLAAHRGHVTVAMVVTAARLRNLKAWERQIRQRRDDLHFLRIADIPEEPPVTLERVVEKLSGRVPEEVSILIDMERRWARELELDTGRPNLLVFDPEGTLVHHIRGRMDEAALDELLAALDRLTAGP